MRHENFFNIGFVLLDSDSFDLDLDFNPPG